jgi:hypothetical protein
MIDEQLKKSLAPFNISLDEFSELLIRLLDYGIISRDESNIEAKLYDRYLACADFIEDYLSIIRIRLFHDSQFFYIRAYPPGAEVPSLPDDDNNAFNSGMRYRPSQQEIAVILALRVEYEKALREGKVNDKGCVLIAFEGLAFAMKNLLKRSLPENLSERKNIFKRLKQLRLIQYNQDEDLDTEEYWISVQPSITNFVSQDALSELYPNKDESNNDLNNSNANAIEVGENNSGMRIYLVFIRQPLIWSVLI